MSRLQTIGDLVTRDPNIDPRKEAAEKERPLDSPSGEEGSTDDGQSTSTPMKETLQTLSKDIQEQKQLGQLIANPLVRQVLDAQSRGEEVEIVPKGKEQERPYVEQRKDNSPPFPSDPESMTNKQVIDFVLSAVPTTIEGMLVEQLGTFQKNQDESLATLKTQVDTIVQDRGVASIEKLKKDYDGVTDDVLQEMLSLHNKVDGALSIDQLFASIKASRGEQVVRKRPVINVESERPTIPPTSRPEPTKLKMGKGTTGFRNTLRTIADKKFSQ